jgi:hypothetical protein
LKALSELVFRAGGPPEVPGDFTTWVNSLPHEDAPETLWLPRKAGEYLRVEEGNAVLRCIRAAAVVGKPAPPDLARWLSLLNGALLEPPGSHEMGMVERVFADEAAALRKTRAEIITDIEEIQAVMSRGDAMSQDSAAVLAMLEKGEVPEKWNRHGFIAANLTRWIEDFVARIDHANQALTADVVRCVNLGLLNSPESLIAAARLAAATEYNWEIEDVRMAIEVGGKPTRQGEFVAVGMRSVCAKWSKGRFERADDVVCEMPPVLVKWEIEEKRKGLIIPAFLTRARRRQVFEVVLPVTEDEGALSHVNWVIRSPALILHPGAG